MLTQNPNQIQLTKQQNTTLSDTTPYPNYFYTHLEKAPILNTMAPILLKTLETSYTYEANILKPKEEVVEKSDLTEAC